MFKFVIILTILVYNAKAIGIVPLELSDNFSEITPRRDPSTATYYRLPKTTEPIRYDVTITTDVDQAIFEFTGNVIIYLRALESADRIIIHHRQLVIDEVSVIEVEEVDDQYNDVGVAWPLNALDYNITTEFLTIPFNERELEVNKIYKLDIDYSGTLRGSKAGNGQRDAGFYRSSYTDTNGDVRWLATTQFESTDARHGFPCYDEPALKAKFNIVLRHGPTYTAISNMPEIDSIMDGDHMKTTFDETPIMSTYLIAFVVSDFVYITNQDEAEVGEVIHRVFGTPARNDQLSFTLEAGVKILSELDTYLGINYYDTIPKMDQIGIPDFAAGAMENWGLVTYAESAFYLSSSSPYNQKDRIAKIVAHEFAHQWFGNLVSPEWWNYIWLNEGFATLYEYFIPSRVYPEYQAWEYFTIQICQRAFITDSVSDVRPMTFDAFSPNEISSLFDRVAYDKSGCVLTMIMYALGENIFKDGLKTYLTDRNQKEANSDHLFNALQDHASADLPGEITVKSAFDTWTNQRGYPMLSVTFDATTKDMTLEQEAFLIDTLIDEDDLIWTIPYNFITDQELSETANEDTTTQGWLATKSETITPDRDITSANWVLFNKKLTGYYRVNYNTENWNAIINYVANSEDAMNIHLLNRAQLLGDAMNIARANRLDYNIPLRLAHNIMQHETSYFTLTPFINDFNYLEPIIFDTISYSKLLKMAAEALSTAYNYFTIDERVDDSHYETIARSNLITFMCRVGSSKCHEDTTAALINYLADGTVSPYLKTVILQNGLRNADSALFLQVWTLIMSSTSQTDRSMFMSALGFTNSEDNIQHLFGSILTANNEQFGDVTINYSSSERNTILTTIASSKVSGFRRVLELLKSEEVTIKAIFGDNIATVFSTLAGRTSTAETLAQLEELMTIYQANDLQNRFSGYRTTAENNIAFNAGAGSTIKAALDSIFRDDPEPPGVTNYILPTDTVPIRYDVTITTDIDQGIFDFTGNVKIYLTAKSVVDRIVIHHRELTIGTVSLIEVKETDNEFVDVGFTWPLKPFIYNVTNEFLTIPLNDVTLTVGRFYKLEIDYSGILRGSKAGGGQSDAGFYRSSYTNVEGVETWLAATQFESTDARHGFPCYDEPALKAKFNIVLRHGPTYTAISNMPAIESVIDGDHQKTTFDVTPTMSTYLIAFVISDFVYISNIDEVEEGEVIQRVFGTPGREDELTFTLEAGVKVLNTLDTYLGVNYYDTIPKMDQIALPDFAAGAMENWGLVTYREGSFYYSPSSPHDQKNRIVQIVAHEFAHQWFGNLVSPAWWNFIWLNEGFATMFAYQINSIAYPEHQALNVFTIQVCQRIFISDSSSTIRPMTYNAFSPREIDRLFDSIAYDKSGCVLSMIKHAIGEEIFKAGLNTYLTDRNQQEANSDHLFTALQTHASVFLPSEITVKSAFEKWTTQRGYPMLTVTFDATTKAIILEQEAFLIDILIDEDGLTWTIPYNFITDQELSESANEDTTTQGWLGTKSETITPDRDITSANWVLFNKKLAGYYRVNYNTDNWNAIIDYVANSENAMKIHLLNRAQLLGDAMNIARSNRLSYDIPLRLAQNMMKHETSYFTVNPFINDFNYLEPITFDTTNYPILIKLAADALSTAYNYYTINERIDDAYHDTIIRSSLISFMCKVGFSKCHEDTTAALLTYLATGNVSSYLRTVILQNGLRNANSALFLKVWTLIMSSTSQADRSMFMSGLGLTNSEDNIQHLLDSILTANNEQFGDVTINYSSSERNTILTTIASSKVSGFRRVLEWLKTEEESVKRIFGDNIATVFSTLAGRTSTAETLTQLKELMTIYEENDTQNRFAGYTATAESNIAWNAGAGSTINAFENILVDYRLPTDTAPIQYDITITTDIDQGNFDFTGNVKIYLNALTATNQIVIHHRELTIGTIRLIEVEKTSGEYIESGDSLPLAATIYDEITEFLTIPLTVGNLEIGHFYKLEIDYTGVLRGRKAGGGQSDAGFYRSSYINTEGIETWLATTQFESTDARHGFPCYDEPALKAKFNIVLRHGATYTAISNMPEIQSVMDGDHMKTSFEVTPIMSTYLIAFVVSDFDHVSNLDAAVDNKVWHRVFGTPARNGELNFTLEAGVKILDEFDRYLGVNYYDTIPKMDQIAIPDFAAGAMENWGLVTYTESAFYYSPSSPHNQKDRIAKIVAHEFAHQWFGNLVSPQWWNFIWLNEGFATVFEFLIPNIVYPEYRALDYFTIQVCQRALITDSVSTVRPMTFDANTPREISSLFDRVAYDKSGCVLTMIMHSVGEDQFKAGLNEYLMGRHQQEGNSDHLFEALQTHASVSLPADLTVNSAFDKWTTQRGYPVLSVTFDTSDKTIKLHQEAFLIDSLADGQQLTWTIPYNFITNIELGQNSNEDTTTQGWLVNESDILTPSVDRDWSAANWVLFNKKLTGYYRVNYNTENWNAIINYVADSDDAFKIHELNRAQLLGDAMNIARANRLSYDIPIRLARNMMKHETSYFTWTPFINDFNFLEQITVGTESYQKLLKLAIEVGTAAYNHYTINENEADTYYDTIIRYNLVNFMCKVRFSQCHEDTTAALISYLDGALDVSTYLKPAILQNGLRNADSDLFLRVWELIMASTTQDDRTTFIAGLGLTNSANNIQHLLTSVLTENDQVFGDVTINYSTTERNTILTTIASNKPSGFRRILSLLKNQEETVKRIFGNNIVTVFSTLASRTSTIESLALLEELMTIYQENDVNNVFAGYIRTAGNNIAWNSGAGASLQESLNVIYAEEIPTETNYRLPTDTVPINYDVTITTDIDKGIFDFTGNVKIYLTALTPTDRIVIHHRQLTIGKIDLIDVADEVSIPLRSFTYNSTNEFLTIPLVDEILTIDRTYKLEIDYSGTLRGSRAGGGQSDAGFYRSYYRDANNEIVWLATTQFESTDARHGFPCYDEPALKATFNIALRHGPAYTAISNMPEISSVMDGDHMKTTFDETPNMSTYLIAFVVSDFDYVSNQDEAEVGEVVHRVFGTPARKDQLSFTLEAGVKILAELDKYLGVNYYDTIPKMDQIAIPDFAAGAMENWGLVTYAESAFYLSPTSPFNQKDRIAKIVAHEFAHQWFGNLVSPQWWNFIWLNEGFATLFEFLMPSIVYPEYQAFDYFTIQICQQRAFITDSVSTVRPMTYDAFSPREISSLFDRVAYDKSGCVLTMIMHAVGEETFKAGLNDYLTDRNQREANSDHLFTSIQRHAVETMPAEITVKSAFEKWTTQRGYPMLTVTFDSITKNIILQQEAFLSDSLTDPEKFTWTIPYNFVTNLELNDEANSDTIAQGWLEGETETLIPTSGRNWTEANWVLFNKKLTSYYRVNYDTYNWVAITNYVANSEDAMKIHLLNRAQLLDDAMNIARSNRLNYNIPLKLAHNIMQHETSYFTLNPFINNFNYLEQITFDTTSYPKLIKLAAEALSTAYNYFTIEERVGDAYYETIMRPTLINFVCKVGLSQCHEDTTAALISYLATGTVSSYLKTSILQNGLRNADSDLFLQVWRLIMSSTSQPDRSMFMSALGHTNLEDNIQHLLDSILTATNEQFGDVTINYSSSERNTILTTIASSKVSGFRRVLEWLKTEQESVKRIFGNNIGTVFSTLAGRTSTEETLVQLNELMTIYEENDTQNRFAGYRRTAENNIAWNSGAGSTIKAALDVIFPEEPEPPTATNYILPTNTAPIRYDVTITTDIDKGIFDFTGNVKIYLTAKSAADRIVIHHRQLTIQTITLIEVQEISGQYFNIGSFIPLKASTYNATNEFLTIPLNGAALTQDRFYKLDIDYSGVLRGTKAGGGQTDAGFYRSSYMNANNVETWLAATQFEATDARHGFPCYDEPALKAIFNIVLKHDPSYTAISNMPEITTALEASRRVTSFATTPKMSTYLIAFVISDFEFVSNLRAPETGKVMQRVFGTPERRNELNFTLEAGVKVLDALDTYLGVKYYDTIPKMDQIGLPDFAAGAMENWGLVTYREASFYLSPTSPYNQKNRIVQIVAHEFAHQWFGNLVSPQWWNYIWLNEGFATLFAYLIPNIAYPEYQGLDVFTIQVCQRVFITDSSSTIRPMTHDAFSPTQIMSLFDSIAYDKSGCVLSMIMHALGENNFKAGLNTYLTDRNQQEANSDHLFTALQTRASGSLPSELTVKSAFDKWTTQRGYPILTVTFNPTTKAITLEQEAFLIDSLTDPDRLTWAIPYNFITDKELSESANEDTSTQGWLTTASRTLNPTAARDLTEANWVLFNKKLTGYYRVNYDTDNWNAIINYVASSDDSMKIHYLNRAQLLGDAMNIARAGRLNYSIPLRLARNMMRHETSYFTWTPFINDFNYLEQITFGTENRPQLLQLAIDVGTAAYNHYTITENDDEDAYYDVLTRFNLVNFMCKVGFTKCLEDTTNALISDLAQTLTVSSYLRPAILQNGLRNANNALYLQVFELIMANTNHADRSTIISGLGLTNSDENIEHLLETVLTANGGKLADVTISYSTSERNTILTTIASNNPSGLTRIMNLLKDKSSAVKQIFGNDIVTVFNTLASRTTTAETLVQLKELMTIYQANDVNNFFPGYTKTAENNIAWNLATGDTIKEALDIMQPAPSSPDAASSMVVSTVLFVVALIITRLWF